MNNQPFEFSAATETRRLTLPPETVEAHTVRLTSSEGRLWRLAMLVLMILALGLAFVSWDQVKTMSPEWEALPIGLVVLVALFGFYMFSKAGEIAELRGLVRGLEQRAAAPPDINQLEKLFGLVERSSRVTAT